MNCLGLLASKPRPVNPRPKTLNCLGFGGVLCCQVPGADLGHAPSWKLRLGLSVWDLASKT